jgi:aspartate ammonia-lyase
MKKLITYLILGCLVAAPVVNAQQTRTEKDLLGEKQIPADAYYGVQTARALENFKLSGIKINHYPGFVEAWAIVKLAAARANTEVGAMKPDRLAAIEKATAAIMDGKYHDQFLVDWYQGGAGTSTNMNANEVLANIGLELTGHKKGTSFSSRTTISTCRSRQTTRIRLRSKSRLSFATIG